MRLSAIALFEKLSESFACQLLSEEAGGDYYGVMQYDGEVPEAGSIVVICGEFLEQLPRDAAGFLAVVTGGDAAGQYAFDRIVLEQDVSAARLINAVTRIFMQFDQWENQINNVTNDLEGIHHMLQRSQDFLAGGLMLADSYYNYLCYCMPQETIGKLIDPSQGHRPSRSSMEALVNDPGLRDLQYRRDLFLYTAEAEDWDMPVLCCNLFRVGEDCYYNRLMLVCRNGRYPHWKQEALAWLGSRVDKISSKLSVFSLPSQFHVNLKKLIQNILLNQNTDAAMVTPALHNFSWDPKDSFQVYVFYPFLSNQSPGSYHHICNQLELLLDASCAITLHDTIVMVCNISHNEKFGGAIRKKLSGFLRDYLYKVGISDVVDGFSSLQVAYFQAKQAYLLGNARNGDYWYYLFSDYVLDYVLFASSREIPALFLCSPIYRDLQSYDQEMGTQYLPTIYAYILEKYNATRAAKRLYIHRTSFLDRLSRIQALFHLDLDDWDTRLLLMLSFRFMKHAAQEETLQV